MSRLEELISDLCPNGVVFRNLEDCCSILDSKRKPITKRNREGGKYPYYGANGIQDYVADYIFDGTFVLVGEDGSVITEAGTPVVTWAEGKIWVNNHAHIIGEDRDVLIRYMYHCLQTIKVDKLIHGNIPKLNQGDFRKLRIPVPPLEVQREIVQILDNFTFLSAELSAELSARRKQYEYYKNALLPFEIDGIAWASLGDISTIVRGASPRPIKNYITEDESGINWIKIGDVSPEAKYITHCAEKITAEGAKKSRYVKAGDFILSNSMSFGRPYILQIEGCIHDGWLAVSDFDQYVTPDYLYHILTSSYIQKLMKQKASFGGAVQNLNADTVRGIKIPIPNLEKQSEIVSVLDRFSLFCTDITVGLPAEIEARKKQYEYYRNKLLTFKEKN